MRSRLIACVHWYSAHCRRCCHRIFCFHISLLGDWQTNRTLASDATYHKAKSVSTDYCPPCEKVRWWRIICDESHALRNSNNKKCDAATALVADNKWLVSGKAPSVQVFQLLLAFPQIIRSSFSSECVTGTGKHFDLVNQLLFLGLQNVGDMFSDFRGIVFSNTRKIRTLPHRNGIESKRLCGELQ